MGNTWLIPKTAEKSADGRYRKKHAALMENAYDE